MNHSDTNGLSYLWCAYVRIPHKNSVLPVRQRKLSIFKFLAQKSVFTWNYKFLDTELSYTP